jgi:REP element-mobilizing transposase RayT
LSENGRIVWEEWIKTAGMRPGVVLDRFVVMPNHLHGLIALAGRMGARREAGAVDAGACNAPLRRIIGLAGCRGTLPRAPGKEEFGRPTSGSLSTIIRLFKAATTKRINAHRATAGAAVWQRGYYERIIRCGESLDLVRRYILENPARWAFDWENPSAVRPEPEPGWAPTAKPGR